MTSILEQQQQFCDATKDELQSALKSIETLQAALEAKEKSCATLENDLGTLRHEFDSVKSKLEQEESMAHDTPSQAVEILEKQLASKDQVCKNLQDEINSLKLVHDKEQRSNEARIEELECALASTERSSVMSHETSESLENELAELKEKEESLRDYVELLEKDKAQLDEELDLAKQKFDSYEKAKRDQQVFIKEQKETIDSLVDLLDKREQDHEAKNARYEAEISELLSKCEDLQQKLSTEEENAAQAELKMISTETANSNLRKENHALESALFQKNALYCAMKTELQNALNDLAVYEQAREQQRNSR
jgi:chromosome segregation ATPase